MNHDAPNVAGSGAIGGDKSIKNLSTVTNLAKSQKLDFAKINLSGAGFLTSKAKETFIYL